MAKKKPKEKDLNPSGEQMSVTQITDIVRKEFGEEAIVNFEEGVKQNVPVISTGSLVLDKALGIGGLPRGRIVEVKGPEASGKTTVCLHTAANAQKTGGIVAFVDTEHALDPKYAELVGVSVEDLLLSQPNTGEEALGIVETLLKTRSVALIIVDSVAALIPRAELEGKMGDAHMGLQARLMSQACRKLTGRIQKSNTLVIFTNQIRMKIGVVWGSPETTSGGNALKFYASVRLDIRRTGSEKDKDDNIISNNVKIKVIKNKLAPPFKIAETSIRFGVGFDYYGELLDMAVEEKLIKKSGKWFSYDGDNIGDGREKAIAFLKEDKDFSDSLYKFITEPPKKKKKKKKRKKKKKGKK